MKNNQTRGKKIERASWIAIGGNVFLATLKIIIGLISGSMAVLADGIDSASDIITSSITLFTGKIVDKKPNIKFPFGYNRADTIAAKFLSFVIFYAGFELFIKSAQRIFSGEIPEMPKTIAIYATLFSIVGKFLLAKYLHKKGKQLDSMMLMANGKNMQNDILISSSVLIGLIFTFIFKLPVLDIITALIVSIWIIKVSYEIFVKTNEELMDGCSDTEVYKRIIKTIENVTEAKNPHKIRVRKQGFLYIIDMDIEVDGTLSVTQGHRIAQKVEQAIKNELNNVYDVTIHIEPIGNQEHERFGISSAKLDL